MQSSWSNELEAQLSLSIVRHLLTTFGDDLAPSEIGVIAPYNGQVRPPDECPRLIYIVE